MAETKVRPAITTWKEPAVKAIANDIKNSNTVAVVNLEDLPSKQLQEIRSKIKKDIKIRVTRKRLLKRALEVSGVKNKDKLLEHLTGMSALLCSNLDSFELFRIIKLNMSDSPAKAGQIALSDILVKGGPTPFSPGPILSELGDAGLESAIEGGKVIIKKDAIVVKEGEEIPEKVASILTRLDIKPMKIGLNLLASLEEGNLMLRKVLDIDEQEYIDSITLAHSEAFKLALSQSILNAETIEMLVTQAARDALALASSQDVLTDETVANIITKADKSAKALQEEIKLKEVNES